MRTRTRETAPRWRSDQSTDHAGIRRPASRRPGLPQASGNFLPRGKPVVLRQTYEWSNWPNVTIRLKGLRKTTTTYDLWRSFQSHGVVVLVEIFEDPTGQREGTGKVKFSPPPAEPFWTRHLHTSYMIKTDDNGSGYNVQIGFEGRRREQGFKIRSPIRPHIYYDPQMKIAPIALHFGMMVGPETFMAMEKISTNPVDEVSFVVDVFRKRIQVTFVVNFQDPRTKGDTTYVSNTPTKLYDRKNKHMFEIPFSQLEKIDRVDLNENLFSLVVSLGSPPPFYRKREIQEHCHSSENLYWTDFDTWYRQTDIVYDPFRLQTATVTTVNQDKPVIDIGICLYILLSSMY
jgi:RNA-dependent RNA polymerase